MHHKVCRHRFSTRTNPVKVGTSAHLMNNSIIIYIIIHSIIHLLRKCKVLFFKPIDNLATGGRICYRDIVAYNRKSSIFLLPSRFLYAFSFIGMQTLVTQKSSGILSPGRNLTIAITLASPSILRLFSRIAFPRRANVSFMFLEPP